MNHDPRVGPSVPCVDGQDLPQSDNESSSSLPSGRNVIGAISPSSPFGVPFDPIAHDLQAINGATNALLDYAIRATPSEALTLIGELVTMREKLNAVIDRAFDQADGFFSGGH